jgi:hypothetical protein
MKINKIISNYIFYFVKILITNYIAARMNW